MPKDVPSMPQGLEVKMKNQKVFVCNFSLWKGQSGTCFCACAVQCFADMIFVQSNGCFCNKKKLEVQTWTWQDIKLLKQPRESSLNSVSAFGVKQIFACDLKS